MQQVFHAVLAVQQQGPSSGSFAYLLIVALAALFGGAFYAVRARRERGGSIGRGRPERKKRPHKKK